VCKTAGELAPCGDALSLHEPLALADQFAGHVIEAAPQDTYLIAPARLHARLPVSACDFFGGARELFDGPRNLGGDPEATQDSEKNASGGDAVGDGANVLLRVHHTGAGDGNDEDGEDGSIVTLERNGGSADRVFTTRGEIENCAGGLAALARRVNERLIARRSRDIAGGAHQSFWIEGRGAD